VKVFVKLDDENNEKSMWTLDAPINNDQSKVLMKKISNLERINKKLQSTIKDSAQEVIHLQANTNEQENGCLRRFNLNDLVKFAVQD